MNNKKQEDIFEVTNNAYIIIVLLNELGQGVHIEILNKVNKFLNIFFCC